MDSKTWGETIHEAMNPETATAKLRKASGLDHLEIVKARPQDSYADYSGLKVKGAKTEEEKARAFAWLNAWMCKREKVLLERGLSVISPSYGYGGQGATFRVNACRFSREDTITYYRFCIGD